MAPPTARTLGSWPKSKHIERLWSMAGLGPLAESFIDLVTLARCIKIIDFGSDRGCVLG